MCPLFVFPATAVSRPPPITREVLQIVGRYAWYDASKAQTELGWTPRPLGETVAETIQWLRNRTGSADRAAPYRLFHLEMGLRLYE